MDTNSNTTIERVRTIIELPEAEGSNLLANYSAYSITGLDSDHPILQLGDQLFEGTYVETVGSHLIFNQDRDSKGNVIGLGQPEVLESKLVFRPFIAISKDAKAAATRTDGRKKRTSTMET